MDELKENIEQNRDSLQKILKRSPSMAYIKLNELALFTGTRHGVNLQIHFPDSSKISDLDSYGTENISIIIDKLRKSFSLSRGIIKQRGEELIPNAKAQDAYIYEGKEGVRILLEKGRLEVLPGSAHLWCKIDHGIKTYVDWLMQNIYYPTNT